MKVGLITRHFIPNYGSLLQTYATCKSIEKFGCEYEIIDYLRNDEEAKNISKALIMQNKNWNKSLFRREIYKIYQFFNFRLMYNVFYKKNLNLLGNKTKRYQTEKELCDELPNCDIFCSGSDQLWGPIGKSEYDPVYFLSFVPSGRKCISYAGSFGNSELSNQLKISLKKLFKKYNHISVREESAKNILEHEGIKSELVLDPTMLLTANEWIDEMNIKKNNKEDYILVYQLHNNKNFDKYVQYLSKKENLKVYIVTSKLNNIIKSGKIIYLPKVQDFLSYIYNAKYVVTDSFHGTVFSIIFNKCFISFTPGETSTRIKSLLNVLSLNNRYIDMYDSKNQDIMDAKIDWKKTNKILSNMQKKSLNWFHEALYK